MLSHPFSLEPPSFRYVKRSALGKVFTREEALIAATRGAPRTSAGVLLVIIDDAPDVHDRSIESATLHFAPTSDGGWSMVRVANPTYCGSATAAVKPSHQDFVAFIRACKSEGALERLRVECTAAMAAEGMGPLAMLDLRPRSGFAQVPERTDVELLRALAVQAAATQVAPRAGRQKA